METKEQVAAQNVQQKEAKFDSRRHIVGAFLGPICAILLWFFPFEGLSNEAHHLLAIMSLVAIWWITEPVPIPVTSLIGPTLCVVLGITTMKEAFSAFGNPMIFLFMGVEKFGKIAHLAIVSDQKAAAEAAGIAYISAEEKIRIEEGEEAYQTELKKQADAKAKEDARVAKLSKEQRKAEKEREDKIRAEFNEARKAAGRSAI